MGYRLNEEKTNLYLDRQSIIDVDSFPDDLSIISNTCIGGRLYHDYHKKFLTPTIDFYMEPDSFVEFCSNLEYYLNCNIIPMGDFYIDHLNRFFFCDIGGLIAAFGHTNDSYEKIVNKWNERKQRVNYNNIVVICTDRNVFTKPFTRCSEETIKEFGNIPYKKVMFSVVDYPYEYVSYLSSFNDMDACPEATRPSINKKGKYILEEDGFDLDKFVCDKEYVYVKK